MSKNKLTKFAEMSSMEFVFQPSYSELVESGFKFKGSWASGYFKNDNPVVLELGCGKGEYSIAMAKLFPEKNFIGIDIKGARIWNGTQKAQALGLTNVAFIRTTIELISFFFDSQEVSEIWITFPDPQMKLHKKRLTGTRFMNLYRGVLKERGLIHLKTDSGFLYNYTCAMLSENNFNVITDNSDIYSSSEVDPLLSIRTHYESQWLSRGKTIKYLNWEMNSSELREPDVEIEFDDYRSYGRERRV